MRLALAYLVLRPLVARSGSQPARGTLPALLGVAGFAGFLLFWGLGLGAAPASHGSLIQGGGAPALAMFFGVALLAERSSSRHLVGMVASLVGVGLAVLPRMEGEVYASLVADGVLLAGTTCFALSTVLGRRACSAGGSLAVVAGAIRYGLLALAPIAAAELLTTGIPSPTPAAVCAILYLGAGCSAAAYALWGYGLSRLPAGQMALFSNLQLVCGIIASAALAGETFTPPQLAGAALVLAGIWYGTTSVTLSRPVLWGRAHMMPVAIN
jgi:probable blue pigment (indigoidine) exporter